MTAYALPPHGGDTVAAARRFGQPAGGWIDLSTGVSPWPYPLGTEDLAQTRRLPDSGLMDELLAAAAAGYGIGPDAVAVAAAGSQAVIQMFPRLRPVGTVAIVGLTYSEHAAAWSAAGHQVIEAASPEEGAAAADMVVVCDPNNPDGRHHSAATLVTLAADLASRDGLLLVDGAFAEVVEDHVTTRAGAPGLVILRSFGKFYGLPGLRLGFALGEAAVMSPLRRALGPWPVNGLAGAVGARALRDTNWAAKTRVRLRVAAARLDRVLMDAGAEIRGGTDLFRLVVVDDAWRLYAALARDGVLTRPFPHDRRLLRVGLPATEAGLVRLAAALRAARV